MTSIISMNAAIGRMIDGAVHQVASADLSEDDSITRPTLARREG